MDDDTQPFCSMIRPKITANFVGDERLYPVYSTLYERSTRPMKLCVPLFTPPGVWLAIVSDIKEGIPVLVADSPVAQPAIVSDTNREKHKGVCRR